MVTFELINENEHYLTYYYYPEGDKNKKPGIIVVDKMNKQIKIQEIAEDEWERDIPPDEINILGEAINNMVRESSGSDFIELATEPEHSIFYGDHAVSEIKKHLLKGEIPHSGRQVWY